MPNTHTSKYIQHDPLINLYTPIQTKNRTYTEPPFTRWSRLPSTPPTAALRQHPRPQNRRQTPMVSRRRRPIKIRHHPNPRTPSRRHRILQRPKLGSSLRIHRLPHSRPLRWANGGSRLSPTHSNDHTKKRGGSLYHSRPRKSSVYLH